MLRFLRRVSSTAGAFRAQATPTGSNRAGGFPFSDAIAAEPKVWGGADGRPICPVLGRNDRHQNCCLAQAGRQPVIVRATGVARWDKSGGSFPASSAFFKAKPAMEPVEGRRSFRVACHRKVGEPPWDTTISTKTISPKPFAAA